MVSFGGMFHVEHTGREPLRHWGDRGKGSSLQSILREAPLSHESIFGTISQMLAHRRDACPPYERCLQRDSEELGVQRAPCYSRHLGNKAMFHVKHRLITPRNW